MLLAMFSQLSSERSLERFGSRFRPFGAGIINEVLLARDHQASTIPSSEYRHPLQGAAWIPFSYLSTHTLASIEPVVSLSPTTSLVTITISIPPLIIKDHMYISSALRYYCLHTSWQSRMISILTRVQWTQDDCCMSQMRYFLYPTC